jgi:membrane protein implicated in regulation of membrane protease activity
MIYGRRPRQLLVVWGASILLIALIYWLEISAPALHELLLPFYWIVLASAFYLTWRWLRARSRKDRRGQDRRRADRRDGHEITSSVEPTERSQEAPPRPGL